MAFGLHTKIKNISLALQPAGGGGGGGGGGMVAQWQHTRLPTLRSAVSKPGPYVGKRVVSYWWLTIYGIEPWPTVCTGFIWP